MKERFCLEVEMLGLSSVITGSCGFGTSHWTRKSRLARGFGDIFQPNLRASHGPASGKKEHKETDAKQKD